MLNVLKDLGIDVYSLPKAIESVEFLEYSDLRFKEVIAQMLDIDVSKVDILDKEAKPTFKYLIVDVFGSDTPTLESANARAKKFLIRYPFALVNTHHADEHSSNIAPAKPHNGKPRKGYKKEMAIKLWRDNQENYSTRREWIDFFCANIENLSESVASTYHHNLNKGHWT